MASSSNRGKKAHRAAVAAVTDAEYEAMLTAQGGGCAICRRPPKTRRLHIDHDHKTMRVRGLLCHRCNRNLPAWITREWLRDAYLYLVKSGSVTEFGR